MSRNEKKVEVTFRPRDDAKDSMVEVESIEVLKNGESVGELFRLTGTKLYMTDKGLKREGIDHCGTDLGLVQRYVELRLQRIGQQQSAPV